MIRTSKDSIKFIRHTVVCGVSSLLIKDLMVAFGYYFPLLGRRLFVIFLVSLLFCHNEMLTYTCIFYARIERFGHHMSS